MFLPIIQFRKPEQAEINSLLESCRKRELTYNNKGMTQTQQNFDHYVVDRNRTKLGTGQSTYIVATDALRNWKHFELGWVQVCTPYIPVKSDEVVCLMVHMPPIWILFGCRIVYVISEEGPIKKFGFAYGTLPGHPESGEEQFVIEWNQSDDSVTYNILAVSQPANWLVRLGTPFARMMQKKFAAQSMQKMRQLTVGSEAPGGQSRQ